MRFQSVSCHVRLHMFRSFLFPLCMQYAVLILHLLSTYSRHFISSIGPFICSQFYFKRDVRYTEEKDIPASPKIKK